MAQDSITPTDPRSGFSKSNSTFYSKLEPVPIPSNDSLDVSTFISSCAHHGNIAFVDASSGRHLTFSGGRSAVDSVSSSLSAMGVRKGHVALLLSPNSIFFPIVCPSVISLGAVINTTNPLNTTQEIAKQIADSKPVLAFTTPPLLSKIADSNLPIVLIGEKSTANATPMAQDSIPPTDPRSGFSKSNSTFYSKREPVPIPSNDSLDVTTFISSCAHHGNIAFVDASSGRHLTFSGVWSAVDSVSSSLSAMGVRKGHVVLLLSPNSIFFPIGCLSVISLGAVITTTQEVAKQIADSKPVLAFTTPPLLSKIADSNLPIVIIGEKSTADATPMAQDRIPPTDPRSGFSKSSCSGPACGCSPSCDCKPECHC